MPYNGCKQAQVGGCKSALVRLGLVWGSIPGLENIYVLVIRLLMPPYKMVIEDVRDFLKISQFQQFGDYKYSHSGQIS